MPNNATLPIIDLMPLSSPEPTIDALTALSQSLSTALSTTGFAYLINAPLTFTHADIFALAHDFFSLPEEEKLSVAKKTFVPQNTNTYRGFFPTQAGSDNLKEGFEIGPSTPLPGILDPRAKFNLTEPNVWPAAFQSRDGTEMLHGELQSLSAKLLSLLAIALAKPPSYFDAYLHSSTSTLRLLHYPPITPPSPRQELCCTPHTDSGLLTLLHQDETGGLEVLSADGQWVAAPYVEGSIVVNIGDLMSKVSGGRFRATWHRVRSSAGRARFSVPCFFERGGGWWGGCVDDDGEGEGAGVLYGRHVLEKMSGWVEFRDVEVGKGAVVETVEEVGVGA
ncbi:hypothetical protein N7G274_007569 [Stereocaulon virgatum]|uniref:Fe2OG dioxygenase domain-containing protein n=1 Tax=Stereocaulon virgatum TaxID=373712 RepID=A0ABR4A1G2_9LECA